MNEHVAASQGAGPGELGRRRAVVQAALGLAGLAAAPAALAAKGGKKKSSGKKRHGKNNSGKNKSGSGVDAQGKNEGDAGVDAQSKHKHGHKPTTKPAAKTLVRATFKNSTTVENEVAADLSATCDEGSGIAVGGGYAVTNPNNPLDPSRGENFVTRSQLLGDTNEYRATLVNHSGITLAFEVEVHCVALK